MSQLVDVAKVGDFVSYKSTRSWYIVPKDESGIETEQHINPGSCKLWRIFEIKNGFVKIISADNVYYLTLCGKVGYANLVNTLNGISKAFVNPELALYGRSLGCSEASIGKLALSAISADHTNRYSFTDDECLEDIKIIKEYGLGVPKSGLVWMASRSVLKGGNSTGFGVRNFLDDHVSCFDLYRVDKEGKEINNAIIAGVRPVITLKPDVGFSSGNGMREKPYVVAF